MPRRIPDGFEFIAGREAATLIQQAGVKVEPCAGANDGEWDDFDRNMIGDGDILMRFTLPDGRVVLYTADQESDYYGGHYEYIAWFISSPKLDAEKPGR